MRTDPIVATKLTNYYKLPDNWQSVRGEKQKAEEIPETAQVFESIPDQGFAYYRIPDIGDDNVHTSIFVSSNGNVGGVSKFSSISHRGDWDGISKEKPEYYSHVPDVLWEAFTSSYDDGEELAFDEIFDLPKWEVGFHKSPPELHYTEVDETDMLSFDYSKILDLLIETTPALPGLGNRDFTQEDVQAAFDRGVARREQLATIRDNLTEVLTPPLKGHDDLNTSYETYTFLRDYGGDESMEEQYIAKTIGYEIKMRKSAIETVAEEKGVPDKLMPQLQSAIDPQAESMETERQDFLNHLLQNGSNLYDHLEVPADMTEQWYTDFLMERIGTIIDEMGTSGTPEGKWLDPARWEMQKIREERAKEQGGNQ